jgi:hypothetical protein
MNYRNVATTQKFDFRFYFSYDMSDSTITSEDEEEVTEDILVKKGNLFKWTNYISGWQVMQINLYFGRKNYQNVILFFYEIKKSS